jgi:hypothetical protein
MDYLKCQEGATFDSWGEPRLLQALFGQFLLSDLNLGGRGVLPLDTQVGREPAGPMRRHANMSMIHPCLVRACMVQAMHKCQLQGKFVLQVDEVVNVAIGARDR